MSSRNQDQSLVEQLRAVDERLERLETQNNKTRKNDVRLSDTVVTADSPHDQICLENLITHKKICVGEPGAFVGTMQAVWRNALLDTLDLGMLSAPYLVERSCTATQIVVARNPVGWFPTPDDVTFCIQFNNGTIRIPVTLPAADLYIVRDINIPLGVNDDIVPFFLSGNIDEIHNRVSIFVRFGDPTVSLSVDESTVIPTVTTFFNHFDQTYVVPSGVFTIDVHIVGSSGGGSNVTGHPAGWGPIFDGVLAVTPGETLTIQPGQIGGGAGGGSQAGTGTAGYPDGGSGGIGPANNRGGGGGGSSRIWRGGVGGSLLLLVAGGGGTSSREQSPNPGTGNGGVPIGQTTTGGPSATGNGEDGDSTFARGGKGATPSAGGAGGVGGTLSGAAGSFMQGGNGAAGTGNGGGAAPIRSGGGGGGGYYGGGGGASGTGLFVPGGCGGGGSSFIDMVQGWSNTTWDTTLPSEGLSLVGRQGIIQFSYGTPNCGGSGEITESMVSTFAGNGSVGHNDGLVFNAEFNDLEGIDADSTGNVFVAEASGWVRKISGGIVTTIAGNGTTGPMLPVDVGVAPNGTRYICDYLHSRILKLTTGGAVSVFAGGVAGFADGTGAAAEFLAPRGICVDTSGNVYVADTGNHAIRKITPSGVVTTLAGDGTSGFVNATGASARFNTPHKLTVDGSGNVIVSDTFNGAIRIVSPAGVTTTWPGSTAPFTSAVPAGSSPAVRGPYGIALIGSDVYVVRSFQFVVLKITSTGTVTTAAGLSNLAGNVDGTVSVAKFSLPIDMAAGIGNSLYVVDAGARTIRKIALA